MAKKQPGKESDFETDAIYILIGLVIAVIVGWFLFGPYIVTFLTHLRRIEMLPFAFVFERANAIYSKLADMVEIPGLIRMEFGNFMALLSNSGEYVRWLYIPIYPFLTYVLFTKCVRLKYQKRHTMATLAKQESVLWPEIAPVIGKQDELLGSDERKGPWAVAMNEWEFAEKYKIAKRTPKGIEFDADRAKQVFERQLGARWTGVGRLKKYEQGIFAAMLLKMVGEGDKSQDAFRLMSKTFASKGVDGMDTSFAAAAIAKHYNDPLVKRLVAQHAYVYTVFATLLQLARRDGVLASPMFLWLKTVDRNLFYTLNNVGRYAFHVECAGIASHWLYEKSVGFACITPMVERAVSTSGIKKVGMNSAKFGVLSGLEKALNDFSEDTSVDESFI